MELYDLKLGKIVNRRWMVEESLGEGACGTVYKVHDIRNPRFKAAMKVEATINAANGDISILRKEAQVIKELQFRPHVVRLYYCGQRQFYSYMVMSLFGSNVLDLVSKRKLSAGGVSRIAVHVLYALKQVHEIGYVHRDVKASNVVVGRYGVEKRLLFLIDYGMCRAYALWDRGIVRIRQPREYALMRGSYRYSSPDVHLRKEQGRKDDLWSLIYVMIELFETKLPWANMPIEDTYSLKMSIPDEVLMARCPQQWRDILLHLRGLVYESRPDYFFVYEKLCSAMADANTSFADPFEWEIEQSNNKTDSSDATSSSTDASTQESAATIETPTTPVPLPTIEKSPKLTDAKKEPFYLPATSPADFSQNVIGV